MWVKRLIAGAIALGLLTTAIVFSYEAPVVRVGKGSGEDAQVVSLEDMSNVLHSVRSLGTSGYAASLSSEEQTPSRYSSVTVTEATNMLSENSYTGNASSSSSQTSFRRKLKIALTENAAYYHSEGQMASHSLYEEHSYYPYFNEEGSMDSYLTRSEREYKTYTDFSIEIYMSAETVLLKVDRLEYYSYSSYTYTNEIDSSQNEEEETWEEDDTLDRLAEHLGEWIDCTSSPEIARDFLTVNESNVETLGSIGDFLDRALLNESQFFTHEDGHYTASEEGLLRLFGLSAADQDSLKNFDGTFDIDLSSAERPSILLDMSNSVSNDTGKLKAGLREEFLFANINNTVVELAPNVRTIDIGEIVGEEM